MFLAGLVSLMFLIREIGLCYWFFEFFSCRFLLSNFCPLLLNSSPFLKAKFHLRNGNWLKPKLMGIEWLLCSLNACTSEQNGIVKKLKLTLRHGHKKWREPKGPSHYFLDIFLDLLDT